MSDNKRKETRAQNSKRANTTARPGLSDEERTAIKEGVLERRRATALPCSIVGAKLYASRGWA